MFKHKLLAAAVAVVALAAIGIGAAWYLLHNNSPDAVSLESALQSVGGSSSGQGGGSGSDEALAGNWGVVQGSNSFVGYRVNETLGGIGATTAVGRTQSVDGTLSYDGDTINSVDIKADLSTLASDKPQRDGQLKRQALETNTYPTATFALTSPISIDKVPADGQTLTKTVKGNLTLHGVTKPIEMDIQGVIQGSQLVMVGSMDIQFADFNIEKPKSAAVVSIEDHGTMEMQLVFAKDA